MNKVILVGRLTRDPETRQAGDTTVTRFSLAVDRRFRKAGDETSPSADFPSCVAFGKTAEFISKYFKQGVKMALEGRLQTGSYEKDGVKHYTTDVIAEQVEFAESKKAEDNPPPSSNEWVAIPEGIENDLPFK
ncbi:MAG: single-stranded DNA-binding protein [Selenomonadaceae bacterium]|nr:single-stranded DNA-binding protein [Selenomonadaceae bacterium]